MKPPLILVLIAAGALQAQTFEVASIKPNNSGSGRSTESTSPGRLSATNITISSVIQDAFGIKSFQISGGPGWLTTDNYDIEAKTGTSRDLNDIEFRPYLQALLADRFHFKYHRDTKELQFYSLTLAKNGAKMTAHAGEGTDSSNNINNGSGNTALSSVNSSMANFAGLLGRRMDRLVVDKTDLKGGYDFKLEWAPNPTAESTDPSIFTALEEQLGLKLESTKGPVEIIVIDNLERPSEN